MLLTSRNAPLGPRRFAFSLIEVVLALGVAALGILAVVAILPTALNSGRESIAQTRAAQIAATFFSTLRSEPFDAAHYTEGTINPTTGAQTSGPTLDLRSLTTSSTDQPLVCYAQLDEVPPEITSGGNTGTDARRLHFREANNPPGAGYTLLVRFNNQPSDMFSARLANQIQLGIIPRILTPTQVSVYPANGEQYQFATIIANRNR